MKRVVVVYERVSSEKQDIKRQAIQRKRAEQEHPGLEMLVIQDDGVSAFKVSVFDRPGGKQLCELIADGRVEAVYADDQDRISRGEIVEWFTFVSICRDNNTRIILNGREVEDDEGGEILGAVNAILARRESVNKSHRVLSGKRQKFEETGLHDCAFAPAGYRKVYNDEGEYVALEVVPEEASIIRDVFLRRARRESLTSLGKFLVESGLRTGRGESRWTTTTVGAMIRNRAYVGEASSGQLTKPDSHPAIVSEAEWRRAQNVRPSFATPHTGETLLAGIVRCRTCWFGMTKNQTSARSGMYLSYVCKNPRCSSTQSIKMETLDAYVVERFFSWVDDVQATTIIAEEEAADQEDLRIAEDELESWLTLQTSIDQGDWLKGYRARQERRDNALHKIDRHYADTAVENPVSLRAEWENLSTRERRSHLAAGIDVVFLRQCGQSAHGGNPSEERKRQIVEERTLVLWRGQGPAEFPKRGRFNSFSPFLFPDESPTGIGA